MAKDKKPKKSRVITKERFDRWSPSHQQRALSDRRTRIRIEDAALPADWLAKRKEARWNRTPITEGSGTTYGDLNKQRAYLEPLTFGEGDRQLADRTQNIGLARQRDADWFQKYRADVQAAQQAAIGAQQGAIAGNQAFIDSANQVSASSRDAVVKQLQDRAAQLGQADQSAEYRGLADAAAASRAAGMTNTAQRQVADANAGVNLATAGVGTAAMKDYEARQYRDYQDNLLQKDKTGYAAKKDAWRSEFIDKAISEARRQVLEDQAFNLKTADTAADNKRQDIALENTVKSGRSNRKIARDRLREQQRAARERERLAAQREARQSQPGSKKDNRSSDRTRRAKRTEAFNEAVLNIATTPKKIIDAARAGAKAGAPQKNGPDFVIRAVMGEYKVSREIAKRIVYAHVAYNGNVPSNVTWKNAPKTWEQALARYNRGR